MATRFYIPQSGGLVSSAEQCPKLDIPYCIPTAGHLHPASRRTDEVDNLFAYWSELTGKSTADLQVGDQVVLPHVVPARSSLQSIEWKLQGEAGLMFAIGWEKKTDLPAPVATPSEAKLANGDCEYLPDDPIPANYEATTTAKVYVQRFDTNAPANYFDKGDRLVLTVTALPADVNRTGLASLQVRINYLTHGNCNQVIACGCACDGSAACGFEKTL